MPKSKRNINIVNAKLGLEMIATVLPVHDPDDLAAFTQMFKGVPWGKMVFALQADIWQAILRHENGFILFDEYLTFFEQAIKYMRGERDKFPDAIAGEPTLAREMAGRRTVLEMELKKQIEARTNGDSG